MPPKSPDSVKAPNPEHVLKHLKQEYDRLDIPYQVQRKNSAIIVNAFIPSEMETPLIALLGEFGFEPDSNGRLPVDVHP